MFYVKLIEMCFSRENNNAQQKPPIEEWKLAYSPQNAYLDKILAEVSNSLGLDEFFGVSNSTALAAAISNDRLVAGVDFHHGAVSGINFVS